MAITDWPSHERPRERLIRGGPGQLSDAELLAIFLRTGTSGKSAVDLGREIMMHFGSLSGLFSAKLKDFAGLNGIGPAKYAQLQAILELARRLLAEDLQSGVTLSSSEKVTNYLQLYFSRQTHESFVVLFLDVKNKLIECSGEPCRIPVFIREKSSKLLWRITLPVSFWHTITLLGRQNPAMRIKP